MSRGLTIYVTRTSELYLFLAIEFIDIFSCISQLLLPNPFFVAYIFEKQYFNSSRFPSKKVLVLIFNRVLKFNKLEQYMNVCKTLPTSFQNWAEVISRWNLRLRDSKQEYNSANLCFCSAFSSVQEFHLQKRDERRNELGGKYLLQRF